MEQVALMVSAATFPFFSSARIDDKGSFYPCGTDSNELCTLLFKHASESAGADKRVGKSVWIACTPPHVPGRFLLLVNTGVLPNADLLAQFSAAEKEQNYFCVGPHAFTRFDPKCVN